MKTAMQQVLNIKRVLMTPELAKELLGSMEMNRNLRKSEVRNLARKMSEGKWHPDSAPPIKIDWNNHTIDGQHRLQATVASNMTVLMDIQYGCDPASQQYIDRGMKRNLNQDLSMRGEKYADTLSAMISPVMEFRDSGKISDTTPQVDYDDAVEWFDKHPECREIVAVCNQMYGSGKRKAGARPLSPAQCSILMHLFTLADSFDRAKEFLSLVMYGTNEIDSPAFRLRDKLLSEISTTKNRMKTSMIYHLSIKAWNSWSNGQTIKQLKHDMKFPVVVKADGNILTKKDFE